MSLGVSVCKGRPLKGTQPVPTKSFDVPAIWVRKNRSTVVVETGAGVEKIRAGLGEDQRNACFQ